MTITGSASFDSKRLLKYFDMLKPCFAAATRTRLAAMGIAARERTVPLLGLHQLFVDDPNGVVVELNFPASEAAG